ncbi:MAG: sensor histidine kinase [Acidobacteriota bacterium]|nr:sensor histidine kinase [Acidobacteriota bacterium]
MHVPPDFAWPRYVSWARTSLSAAALVATYLLSPASPRIYLLLGTFLAFSVALAIRSRWQRGAFGLLVLFSDTIFFLIVAGFGTGHLLWLASLFYLYLLAEALVFYTQVEVLVVVAVSALFCAVLPAAEIRFLELTVVVAGAVAVAFAINKQRQQAKVEELERQLREAQTTAQKACEQERVRIASDFHDGPLQSFISLQMRLEILRKLMERDLTAGMQDLKQLHTLAQSQVRDLRAFLHSMRPVDVEGGNLVSSARRTAELFQKESGLPVTFLGTNAPVGLPQEISAEVLQMLREALHNVQKHAAATRVAVSMEKTERGLEISVDDNGHGFNFAGTYTLEELELLRLGPASLKRRARSLNADLLLESRPGRGTGLKFRIPLQ